ncbi:MAG: hypothetical protein GF349_03655 [Candidatus Magasanikbacteria bacterium]|nr:hypothetical protein [Candidatus Magasanikbacteria bacterium]
MESGKDEFTKKLELLEDPDGVSIKFTQITPPLTKKVDVLQFLDYLCNEDFITRDEFLAYQNRIMLMDNLSDESLIVPRIDICMCREHLNIVTSYGSLEEISSFTELKQILKELQEMHHITEVDANRLLRQAKKEAIHMPNTEIIPEEAFDIQGILRLLEAIQEIADGDGNQKPN